MDNFVLMSFGIVAGCFSGIAFLVYKIIEEEREKKEKESMVRIHYKHYNKDGTCSECGCLPCQCGS
jgi:hypothetical protein